MDGISQPDTTKSHPSFFTLRSVAPTIGGYLMSTHGFESLGYVGVACNVVALSMVAKVMKD